MALFGRGRPRGAATNAPPHWPSIDALGDGGDHDVGRVAHALAKGLSGRGARVWRHDDLLFEDGLLRLPVVVAEGEQRSAVFVYARADAQAAGHYAGARVLLRARAQMAAVYYAPAPLATVPPGAALEPLDTPHFRAPERPRAPAEYALWWPTPDDPWLHSSPALGALERWFEALDGHAALLFSALLRALGLVADEPGQPAPLYALPDETLLMPASGPAGTALYLHASRAAGLWLAFDTRTPPARRDLLLRLLADLAVRLRASAERHGIDALAAEQGVALQFWRATRADALSKEAAGAVDLRLGRIAEEGELRRLDAGATSAAEREAAAGAARPGADVTALAREALEHALGQLSRDARPAEHEPGATGAPNVHPFVLLREQGETRRRSFWNHAQPEALQAAIDTLAERPRAALAAFVCDAYLRQGDARTDALFVRAQARDESACHVFVQRYRPRRQDQEFALLGTWALMGRGPSLFGAPAEHASHEGAAPSERGAARAHEALQATLRLAALGERSARASEADEPLVAPALYLWVAGQVVHVGFALMSVGQARRAARASARREPAELAAFVTDVVESVNGQARRELHIDVHERDAPCAFRYAQAYDPPSAGHAFALHGALRLVGPVDPLLANC